MNKVVILLSLFMILMLSACGRAPSTPAVLEPTQAATQTIAAVFEPAAQPTDSPTNTPQPTVIPPTPTVAPEAGPTGFVSSGVSAEDLVEYLPIFDLLISEKLTLMAEGIALGGILDRPSDVEYFTVFAAEALPEGLTGKEAVDAISYLIVPGLYLEADLLAMDGQSIPTMVEGQVIDISVKDGKVSLNDTAMITRPDLLAQNGVVHVIDKFILPPAE